MREGTVYSCHLNSQWANSIFIKQNQLLLQDLSQTPQTLKGIRERILSQCLYYKKHENDCQCIFGIKRYNYKPVFKR